jgi:FkbM family methyltransferase
MDFRNFIFRSLRPIVHFYTDLRRAQNIEDEINLRFPDLKFEQDVSLVIDLGANRGDFTFWARSKGALVIAVEPDSEAFRYMVNRTRKTSNLTLLNCAAFNTAELIKLHYHSNRKSDPIGHSISSSLIASKKNVDQNSYSIVLGINLKSLFSMQNIKIVKIDIEGAEKYIWEEIELNYKHIEYLVIEIHEAAGLQFKKRVEDFIALNKLENNWKSDWA